MSTLEREEKFARKSARILNRASNISLAVATLATGLEAAKKHSNKAAKIGLMGAVIGTELKIARIVFDNYADKVGMLEEALIDSID